MNDLFEDIAPPLSARHFAGSDYRNEFWCPQRKELIGIDTQGVELWAAYTGNKWAAGFKVFNLELKKPYCFELMPGELRFFNERGFLKWPDEPLFAANINHAYAIAANAAQEMILSFGIQIYFDYELLLKLSTFCRNQRLSI